MAAASSPASAILRVAASAASNGALADGPLTVEREDDPAGPLGFDCDFGCGLACGRAALRFGLRVAMGSLSGLLRFDRGRHVLFLFGRR